MSEVLNIPKLRFPEFSGDWEEKKLGDIAAFSKGKGISKSDIDDDGSLECIRYGELYTSYNELIKNIHSKTNIAKEDVNLSQIGDVIIPSSGETAIDLATASCVLKNGVAIGGDLNIIRSDIDGVFNAYYLNNSKKNSIARLSQGSSVIHLYSNHLKELKLNLPTKLEQQKIASFLASVDKKIEQLGKEQELLSKYKKGLMQKIFSQEVRFKTDDKVDYPDWDKNKLKELFEVIMPKKVEEGLSPYLEIGDINSSSHTYTLKEKKTVSGALAIEKNVLLISTVRPNLNKIVITKENLYASSAFATIKLKNSFLFHLLTTKLFNNLLIRLSEGGTYPTVNKQYIYNLSVNRPSNEEEIKIANFLSSLDSKIEQIVKQLDETKQFKKALLQQMFV